MVIIWSGWTPDPSYPRLNPQGYSKYNKCGKGACSWTEKSFWIQPGLRLRDDSWSQSLTPDISTFLYKSLSICHFRRISCIRIMCQQETRTADRITDETDCHPTDWQRQVLPVHPLLPGWLPGPGGQLCPSSTDVHWGCWLFEETHQRPWCRWTIRLTRGSAAYAGSLLKGLVITPSLSGLVGDAVTSATPPMSFQPDTGWLPNRLRRRSLNRMILTRPITKHHHLWTKKIKGSGQLP